MTADAVRSRPGGVLVRSGPGHILGGRSALGRRRHCWSARKVGRSRSRPRGAAGLPCRSKTTCCLLPNFGKRLFVFVQPKSAWPFDAEVFESIGQLQTAGLGSRGKRAPVPAVGRRGQPGELAATCSRIAAPHDSKRLYWLPEGIGWSPPKRLFVASWVGNDYLS